MSTVTNFNSMSTLIFYFGYVGFTSNNFVENVFQQQLLSGVINPLPPAQSTPPPSCLFEPSETTNPASQPQLTTTQTVPIEVLSHTTTVQNGSALLTTLMISSSSSKSYLGIDTIDTIETTAMVYTASISSNTEFTEATVIQNTTPSTTAWIASTTLPTETIFFSTRYLLPSSSLDELTTASVITTTHSRYLYLAHHT